MKNKLILTIIAVALAVCTCVSLVACNTNNEENTTDATAKTTEAVETEGASSKETAATTVADTSADTTADTESDTTVTDTEAESTTEEATETETESESVSEAESEETTLEDTSDEETEETTEYRFDYFSESMKDYASIDPSVYESFSVSVGSEYEISDEVVSAYLEDLCYDYKYAVNGSTKVTNQPIQKGDVAYIFYRGIMDGEEFEGGSNMDDASPYALTIGSGQFIDGFEDALIGIIPNETSPENMVAINLTFPENYYEGLSGRDVTFYVYVSWIVEYEIPEFNESFVRDTLKYETESEDIVAAYVADVIAYLTAQAESQLLSLKENHIWTTLIEGMTVTKYPEGEVEAYYDYYYTEVEYYYTYYTYMGMKFESLDDFARQFLGLASDADWLAEITKYAEDAAKQTMAYHIVAEDNGIELTKEDVNKEIDSFIDYYKDYYGKTYTREEILENMGEVTIKESALCTKVLEYLLDRITIIYE